MENVGKKAPFHGVSCNYPGRARREGGVGGGRDASNIREMGGVQGAR